MRRFWMQMLQVLSSCEREPFAWVFEVLTPPRASTALNIADRKVTVLAPTTGSLSNRVAVTGSFQYQDI